MLSTTASGAAAEPDRLELERHIAATYSAVARRQVGGLPFPTGRPVAEAAGYPAALLDRLPWAAVASCAGVGHHLDLAGLQQARAFREVARVLRPGGRLAQSDIVTDRRIPAGGAARADLWAACIAGAAQRDEHVHAIAEAGRLAARPHPHHHPRSDEVSTTTHTVDVVRNGVDTAQMFGTLDLIKAQPELARFQFRATNRWLGGAHNRSTIQGFYAAGGEDATRERPFELDAGEPAILLGHDTGANPAEFLLHALAACLTTSIVYVAAARKVRLTSVESTVTGDMDVRGALGVDPGPRNGFERIRIAFRITGDAPEAKLLEVAERGRQRSAVYDMVTNGVPVAMEVATA